MRYKLCWLWKSSHPHPFPLSPSPLLPFSPPLPPNHCITLFKRKHCKEKRKDRKGKKRKKKKRNDAQTPRQDIKVTSSSPSLLPSSPPFQVPLCSRPSGPPSLFSRRKKVAESKAKKQKERKKGKEKKSSEEKQSFEQIPLEAYARVSKNRAAWRFLLSL